MLAKPDLVINGSVEAPCDRRCSMGHVVPDDATINGGEVRFFRISSDKDDFGLVCETCLTVANYMARRKKQNV